MPRVRGGSWGDECFLMGEVPLYGETRALHQVHHSQPKEEEPHYRDTSLIRNHPPLGPYRRPVPRVLGGS